MELYAQPFKKSTEVTTENVRVCSTIHSNGLNTEYVLPETLHNT